MNSIEKQNNLQVEPENRNCQIVNKIINILSDSDLSISEARNILNTTSRKLGKQKITSISL